MMKITPVECSVYCVAKYTKKQIEFALGQVVTCPNIKE